MPACRIIPSAPCTVAHGNTPVALVLANLAHEKFGGDSLAELKRNFDGYIEQIRSY